MSANSRLAKVQYETTYAAGIQQLLNVLYADIRPMETAQGQFHSGTEHIFTAVSIIPTLLTQDVRKKI